MSSAIMRAKPSTTLMTPAGSSCPTASGIISCAVTQTMHPAAALIRHGRAALTPPARASARSAYSGTSGFIDTRGDVQQKLGWDRRGILTGEVELNSELTFYTRYGDYLGRISELLMGLCILYYIAYRIKKKNHLVKYPEQTYDR